MAPLTQAQQDTLYNLDKAWLALTGTQRRALGGPAVVLSHALHVRISRIPGVTPKKVLRSDLTFGAVLGDFEYQDSAEWRDYSTVAAGQRSQPGAGRGEKGRNLRALTLEVLTQVGPKLPFEIERAARGQRTREALFNILHARAPFRLVAYTPAMTELRMNASVRSIGKALRHGEADSRYLSLEIVEYRAAHADRRSRHKTDKLPTKHTIKAGDTLRHLSKHYYKGKGQGWHDIKGANRGMLKGYGPDEKLDKLLKAKVHTLKIPELVVAGINSPDDD